MSQNRTRKIVVAGIMAAISCFLGLTHWGFITWIGFSFTIMQIPVIIGAVLEGPIVGFVIGLIFGVFSMVQATIAPGPFDAIFIHPLVAIPARLFIGPVAWLVWQGLKRWPIFGLIITGIAGSMTNTILVLGMVGILRLYSWPIVGGAFISNGLPEAVVSSVSVLAVISAWRSIPVGKRQGSSV